MLAEAAGGAVGFVSVIQLALAGNANKPDSSYDAKTACCCSLRSTSISGAFGAQL